MFFEIETRARENQTEMMRIVVYMCGGTKVNSIVGFHVAMPVSRHEKVNLFISYLTR